MSDVSVVGIDLGGTNLRAGLVDASGRILEREARPTRAERGPAAVIDEIAALAASVARGGRAAEGIGVGSPGPLDAETGVVFDAPNLAGWRNVPLKRELEARTGLPVRVENDANAAAFGEAWLGAGRGARILVCVTLGTGIGGGIVADGAIVRGTSGVAGEIGHVTIDPGGPLCGCGNRGCVEAFASATAVVRAARERIRAGERSALPDDPGLDAAAIAAAARSGDPLAVSVLGGAGTHLGLAASIIAHLLNPDRIVFSGGLAGAGPCLFGPLIAELERRTFPRARAALTIALAGLGDDAGLVGAARAFLAWRGLRT